MYHTCQYCSYESPLGAKFCRQCGAQFFVETEGSAAGTRNFGRQEPAPSVATAGSGHLPPSVADTIAGETDRFYRAPYVPAPTAHTNAPIKSRIGSWLGMGPWRWIFLLLVLFIGISIGAMVARGPRRGGDSRPLEERERVQRDRDARRRQDEMKRRIRDQAREAEDRERETRNRIREALDAVAEANKRAIEAGAAVASADDKPLDLSRYEYPKTPPSVLVKISGHEMLTIRTTDSLDAVNEYYQNKLGMQLILKDNETVEKRVIYQSNTSPKISVSVETVPGLVGPEVKIVVLRSPLQFLRFDENQNP